MTELEKYTDKLTVQESNSASDSAALLPFVEVLTASGEKTGLAFHGVPGGHEFTSFILGLYNAAGPGSPLTLPSENVSSLSTISAHADPGIPFLYHVPGSCDGHTRIASLNPLVTAEVYDIAHFPDLKEKYHVMSVPCLIINQDKTSFGKKNIQQILELI